MAEGTVTLSTKESLKLLNENKAMEDALEGKGVLLKNVGWNSDGETEVSFILVPEERKNEFLAVAFKQTIDMLDNYINKYKDLLSISQKLLYGTAEKAAERLPDEYHPKSQIKPHSHWRKE